MSSNKPKKSLFILGIFIMFVFASCKFFNDGRIEQTSKNKLTSLSFGKQQMTVKVGEMAHVAVNITPSSVKNDVKLIWEFNAEKIQVQELSGGAVITGVKEGQTTVTVRAENLSAALIVTVAGYTDGAVQEMDPYITSNQSILQMNKGDTSRLSVSLFNGSATDIDGYTWTVIDNTNVVSLSPNGQHALVTAKEDGYARIKVTHNKAAHPYYFGVYVFADLSKTTYITTTQNIVTLNKGKEQTITVNLQNPPNQNYQAGFKWEVLDTEGSNPSCISTTFNGNQAIVRSEQGGQAVIRVTHPDAGIYPLDITVRCVEIVKNVYIEPSETLVVINGTEEKEVTASLAGLPEGESYSPDEFVFEVLDKDIVASYSHSDRIFLTGLKNGSTKIIISHPMSATKREVLVVTENQTGGAVDASHYITTSQNYIKTKVTAEETLLNILLKGGVPGDEKNFNWEIKHSPVDGHSKVIEFETTDGNVSESTRVAANTAIGGLGHVTPLAEGTATIVITHPKAYYPTEILVKVLPANAVLEEQFYFSGTGFVTFLNSETYTYNVDTVGSNATESDIQWTADNDKLKILANGKSAVLSSTATGANVFNLTINHPNAQNPKKVVVITGDTQEEINSVKVFFSDKIYHSVNVGKTTNLFVNAIGFGRYDEESEQYIPEDFSTISWTSKNPSIAIVEKSDDDPLTGIVTGKSAGQTTVTASYNGTSLEFTVTVYPEDVDIGQVEKTIYLTTSNNVVILSNPGDKRITVSAIGLEPSKLSGITWTSSAQDIATVVGNGESATITGIKEGEAQITVSHPLSENQLTIYVRIGSEYVIDDKPVVYITPSTEVIALTKDSPQFKLDAALMNYQGVTPSEFSFAITDPSIANITSQFATGYAFIKPFGLGVTEVTISHPDAVSDKKVLVVVGNTQEELEGFKYLTTGQNVITMAEGSTKNISVSIANTQEIFLDGFSWTSDNPSVVGVGISSSSTALITGNKPGTTKLIVTHNECDYPLEIIVQVVDKSFLQQNPFIQTAQNVITTVVASNWTTVTAELVGGTKEDAADFVWSSTNSQILQVVGQNGEGRLRGIAEGMAYVTVTHPKSVYEAQILVIVSPASSVNYSISVGENIIQLKPAGNSKTITATLVGGDINDKYNFKWSLDVYDVVDMTYTANTAIITPKQQGQCTLTVSHPKSAYSQQVIIKVSEYTNFGFGITNKTITEGKSTFINMQVPVTAVESHVEYTSSSPKVASVQGTNSVCQLTGVAPGTTTIKAKLVATATNTVQAEADLLVSVEEGTSDLVYISASTTIYTVEKGLSKTLTATLTGAGVLPTDQNNLQWKSSDPKIVSIRGSSSTGVAVGKSVYIEALKEGEATITVSHDKSNSNLVFYIIVPGEEEKTITLNKTYATIDKGASTDITASISGGSTEDYNSITWSADKVDDQDIVRVMGRGKTVNVYGVNPGIATVRAQLPNGKFAICDVEVQSTKQFSFGTTTVRVQPGKEKEVSYTVSPANAGLQWVQNDDSYVTYQDMGNDAGKGTVIITGIKEGNSTLTCVTSYGSKATLQVICAWDYHFSVNKAKLQGVPNQTYTVEVKMNPVDTELTVDESNIADIVVENNGDGTALITVTPTKEGKDTITVTATNPSTKEQYGTKNIALDFGYENLTFETKLLSKTGNFSKYDEDVGIVTIGDGETAKLSFSVKEDKAEYNIQSVTVERVGSNSEPVSISAEPAGTGKYVYNLIHSSDNIQTGWIVDRDCYFTVNGARIDITSLGWHTEYDGCSRGHGVNFNKEWGRSYVNGYSQISRQLSQSSPVVTGSGVKMETEMFSSPRFYTDTEFKNNLNWYAPSWSYSWCQNAAWPNPHKNGPKTTTDEYIINTWARKGNNFNTTLVSRKQTHNILITYNHNGKNKTMKIPVYTEIRNCPKTQQ